MTTFLYIVKIFFLLPRKIKYKVFLISTLLFSNFVYAWGALGHESVCEIAYQELTPSAKQSVDEILSKETDSRFKTFRDACVWPDYIGKAQAQRKPEHYINVPRYWHYIKYENCVDTDRCLFTAIRKDESILRDKKASSQAKLEALKFLGHWLGDIHQPLHVSFKDDRGGNDIALKKGIGCRKKLHAVWDTCIPEDVMKEEGFKVNLDNRESFAKKLHTEITGELRSKWTKNMNPAIWADESFKISLSEDTQYCIKKGKVCWYSSNSEEYYEHAEGSSGIKELILSGKYEDQWGEVVKERIQMGGVRLGALLNDIFQD